MNFTVEFICCKWLLKITIKQAEVTHSIHTFVKIGNVLEAAFWSEQLNWAFAKTWKLLENSLFIGSSISNHSLKCVVIDFENVSDKWQLCCQQWWDFVKCLKIFWLLLTQF